MKYKEGDKVKVKSLDWYNKNKNERGNVRLKGESFVDEMSKYCGKEVTISKLYNNKYSISENDRWVWTEEMFEDTNMKELVISEEKDKEIYKTANNELKTILEDSFGKDFFIESITDKIRNRIDAFNFYIKNSFGIKAESVTLYSEFLDKTLAYYQALIIVKVLNEGWEADFNNNETKYYIYYDNDGGTFRTLSSNNYAYNIGLYFKTRKLAMYFINTFPDLCNDLYK